MSMFSHSGSRIIRLTPHGLKELERLYVLGSADCLHQRTSQEEAFFTKFCDIWDYREYSNRSTIVLTLPWWDRVKWRLKMWLLEHL